MPVLNNNRHMIQAKMASIAPNIATNDACDATIHVTQLLSDASQIVTQKKEQDSKIYCSIASINSRRPLKKRLRLRVDTVESVHSANLSPRLDAAPLSAPPFVNSSTICRNEQDAAVNDLTNLNWLQDSNLLKNINLHILDVNREKAEIDLQPPLSSSSSPILDLDLKSCPASTGSTSAQEPTYRKPPYSYSALIFMAIESSPNKSMLVRDIYKWIIDHFPYFASAPSGWKNTIRHTLSLRKCFKKIDKCLNGLENGGNCGDSRSSYPSNQSSADFDLDSTVEVKGAYWLVDDEYRLHLQHLVDQAQHPWQPLTTAIIPKRKRVWKDVVAVADQVGNNLCDDADEKEKKIVKSCQAVAAKKNTASASTISFSPAHQAHQKFTAPCLTSGDRTTKLEPLIGKPLVAMPKPVSTTAGTFSGAQCKSTHYSNGTILKPSPQPTAIESEANYNLSKSVKSILFNRSIVSPTFQFQLTLNNNFKLPNKISAKTATTVVTTAYSTKSDPGHHHHHYHHQQNRYQHLQYHPNSVSVIVANKTPKIYAPMPTVSMHTKHENCQNHRHRNNRHSYLHHHHLHNNCRQVYTLPLISSQGNERQIIVLPNKQTVATTKRRGTFRRNKPPPYIECPHMEQPQLLTIKAKQPPRLVLMPRQPSPQQQNLIQSKQQQPQPSPRQRQPPQQVDLIAPIWTARKTFKSKKNRGNFKLDENEDYCDNNGDDDDELLFDGAQALLNFASGAFQR